MNQFPSSVVGRQKLLKTFQFGKLLKFAKLSDHTEIAYTCISARVWSSFAYKTNKMAVSEILEQT